MDQGAKERHIHRLIHGRGESTVKNQSKALLIPGVYDYVLYLVVFDQISISFSFFFWGKK